MTNKEEFLSSTTTDKVKYIKTWNEYIQQLTKLALPLMHAEDGLFDELTRIQDRLEELVLIAADEDFKDGKEQS